MADVGRTAAPQMVRLVAAGGPDVADGEVRFHRRLTVLADTRMYLADWVSSLLGVHAPPDTLLEIDNVPARTYDLPRSVRSLPVAEALRADMLRAIAAGGDALGNRRNGPRTSSEIEAELARWDRVLDEAKARLLDAHDVAPRVDPVDLAEASRLRNEWKYSEHVDEFERRRRSRRELNTQRRRYQQFLSEFGASSYEDLSMVGTGFGDTNFDVAIREAATVVSMAEQRCHKLRMELDQARRDEGLTADERAAKARAAIRSVDLASFDAADADRLVARALAEFDDTAYVRPLVVDRVLDGLAPDARRRAFDRLLAHARRRQTILITAVGDVARWAEDVSPADASLALDFTRATRIS